jgi:hypothetical protein
VLGEVREDPVGWQGEVAIDGDGLHAAASCQACA